MAPQSPPPSGSRRLSVSLAGKRKKRDAQELRVEDLLPELKLGGDDSQRVAGPPPPLSVRTSGDPALASAMAAAVSANGRVERATHGFHTYPAGMHPDCAAAVIQACAGDVHDPFCGGGTVLVEAALAGRGASGTDLSPIALLVASARCADPAAAAALRSASRRIAAAAQAPTPVEADPLFDEWYEPHVRDELARMILQIREVSGPARGLLEAVFSSIVVKASYRESDTSNKRVVTHRPRGTTAVLFHKKARELARKIEALPPHTAPRLRLADARAKGPPPGTGLVLTSPPYPGVYDYLPMQQLRLVWLGLDAGRGMASEVGSRRSFRALGRGDALDRWRADTAAWIGCQGAALESGGRFAIVVGDGLVGEKPVDALSPTMDALRAAGLEVIARASADRADHARDTIRTEHIVLAEKRNKPPAPPRG
ncbi:MAG: hypothetical protein JNM72_11845 [Deltaproteobacteria bacterium]|nr:hypothetical protein [Deltaproteobacteria bacterium]